MSSAPPLFSFFYGDDFTGTMSTAEIFVAEGIPTVVFTSVPDPAALRAKFPGVRAAGLAGTARSEKTEALERILPPVFRLMKESGAASLLYKVCSTFDSAPQVGSIGRAVEIALGQLPNRWVALIPAAPRFGRFVLFGNLFASAGAEEVFRLDRHPSMARHPVTPMEESDLLRHLSRQTALSGGLIDIRTVHKGGQAIQGAIRTLAQRGDRLLLFDSLAAEDIAKSCAAVLALSEEGAPPLFVGSHEVAFGIASCFRENAAAEQSGLPASEQHTAAPARLLAVSGSCAPVSAGQIEWARSAGFAEVAVRTEHLLEASQPSRGSFEESRVVAEAAGHLERGSSVVIHTAIGPEDPRVRAVVEKGGDTGAIRDALGRITRSLIARSGVRRIVVLGGDTSGAVLRHLGTSALQVIASIPGAPAPLCIAHGQDPETDGLELALKGGQVGAADYLGVIQQTGLSPRKKNMVAPG